MMKFKKIIAVAVAAVSIGAIGVTASAAEVNPLPAKWIAVYQSGAATSVNTTYYITVEGRTRGYKGRLHEF